MNGVAQYGCDDHRSDQERDNILELLIKLVHPARKSRPEIPIYRFRSAPSFSGRRRAIGTSRDHGRTGESKFYTDDFEATLAMRTKISLIFTQTLGPCGNADCS